MDELLQRCSEGDAEAIATLVRRFRAKALDLASGILRDRHLAEDAVQRAFLKALERLADLRDPESFPGWFRQIVRRECSRIVRRRKETVVPAVEPQTDESPLPSTQVARKDLYTRVRAALESLPRASREAAELFYLEEMGCMEVSSRLGVPVGTVKRRLHDAREQLRSSLLGHVPRRGVPQHTRPTDWDLPL
jgi:RNA polymerase sigma factor (sigma-70 family)